jgi:hypothetical protein
MPAAAMIATFKHRHTISSLAAKYCSNPVILPRFVILSNLDWIAFCLRRVHHGIQEARSGSAAVYSRAIDFFFFQPSRAISAVGLSLFDVALKTPSTLRNPVFARHRPRYGAVQHALELRVSVRLDAYGAVDPGGNGRGESVGRARQPD